MITISLCMIVKDEEAILARCLDSIAHVVDEIIIVDTGSSDKTKEIASEYTTNVFDFEWVNDFSKARNEAFSKATCDYQMWLDSDDVVPEASANELLELKKTLDPAVDFVTMKYITDFDEDGCPILISTRERLVKRSNGSVWLDPVHEYIPMKGRIVYSDIVIHHKKIKEKSSSYPSFRNLRIYSELEKSGASFSPRQLYYFARELKDHGDWIKSAYYFNKFLNSDKGWAEDKIATCYNLSVCYNSLGETEKILPILLRSFVYDAPRAEICSEIGYYYKRAEDYVTALKWFELSANLTIPDTIGFILQDYWGYIPNIECCFCCCKLGDFERGREFNERAAAFKPHSASIKHNREYLSSK